MKKTSIFFILTAICVSSFNGMIGDNTTLAANLPQGPKKLNTTTVNITNKVSQKDDEKIKLGKPEAKLVQEKAPKKDDSKLKEAAIEEDKKVVGNKPLSKPEAKPSPKQAPKKVAAAPSPPKAPVTLTPEQQQQKQMDDIQRKLHEQDEVNKVILNAVQHDRKILKSHHEAISAIGKQGSVEPPSQIEVVTKEFVDAYKHQQEEYEKQLKKKDEENKKKLDNKNEEMRSAGRGINYISACSLVFALPTLINKIFPFKKSREASTQASNKGLLPKLLQDSKSGSLLKRSRSLGDMRLSSNSKNKKNQKNHRTYKETGTSTESHENNKLKFVLKLREHTWTTVIPFLCNQAKISLWTKNLEVRKLLTKRSTMASLGLLGFAIGLERIAKLCHCGYGVITVV
ncbi:hypothetical protein HOF26_01230 [bacterium]|nr:hypothetical protein [bacterium]